MEDGTRYYANDAIVGLRPDGELFSGLVTHPGPPGWGGLTMTCYPCWHRVSEVNLVIANALCHPPSRGARLMWWWRRFLRKIAPG
jgi:hypothetical protein